MVEADDVAEPAPFATPDGGAHPISAIDTFLVVDRLGAVLSLVLILMANVIVSSALLFLPVGALVVLIAALTLGRRLLGNGSVAAPLLLATGGNWLCAVTATIAVPQIWPVMVVTVLMPVVLATPFARTRALLGLLVGAALTTGLVATLGLIRDDAGALPDLSDELELLLVIGSLIAQTVPISLIVWNNSRLQQRSLDEIRRSQLALADSRRRVAEAADGERQRIERDLHDGAQQQLVALGIHLRSLGEQTEEDPTIHGQVEALMSGLDTAVQDLRRLAHGIYPPLLETQGLAPALRATARASGLDVRLAIDDIDRAHPSVERALYFAALEAMTNAAKHAPGSTIDIAVRQHDRATHLEVRDDGPGFVVDEQFARHGTHNMGDRLAAVGGVLRISSTPGEGTTVTANAPTIGV